MLNINKLSWKHAVFFTYCLLLAINIFNHEPWFDEAQAWLLARDANLFDLFSKYLRYEGSPGLWHLLLMLPAKLGFPYFSLNITAGIIACAGVYLFIFYSPFPPVIKLLFPFSFFVFYQYAVVARSYTVIPLLLFLIAIFYERRFVNPFAYITFICLLANTSLHGFIISLSLVFFYFIDMMRGWSRFENLLKFKSLICLTVFFEMSLLLVLQLRPAPDLISFAAFNKDLSDFFHKTIYMLSDSMITTITIKSSGAVLDQILHILFACTLVLSLLLFIIKKKLLYFLIPTAGLGILFTVIYSNQWHQGSLFLTWIFVLWISYQSPETNFKFHKGLMTAMSILISTVLLFQAGWSLNSMKYDLAHNYSASRDAAKYIKENNLQDKRIYMTGFHTISILPYFDKNIFCNYINNQAPCFWLWSQANNIYSEPYLYLEKYDPDIIVMGVKDYIEELTPLNPFMLPSIPGYRPVKYFDGGLYWKNSPYETDSFAIFERIPETP